VSVNRLSAVAIFERIGNAGGSGVAVCEGAKAVAAGNRIEGYRNEISGPGEVIRAKEE
jgi:hypothetical protein